PMLGRSLELHVLEQVSHACLAIALMPRAHEIRDVHCRLWLGLVRKEQDAESIRETIFRDAFDAHHFREGRTGNGSLSGEWTCGEHGDTRDGADCAQDVHGRHTTSREGGDCAGC